MSQALAIRDPKYYAPFMQQTSPENIHTAARDLNKLVNLAELVECHLMTKNPHIPHGRRIGALRDDNPQDLALKRQVLQWHVDRLSEVKQRLANAIVCKREYYENTWMGKITKFFLKLFCSWNNGNTSAIRHAEDFLLRYDSRYPIERDHGAENYWPMDFWLHHPATWLQQNLNLQNFYNYNPPHGINVRGGNSQQMPQFMVCVN